MRSHGLDFLKLIACLAMVLDHLRFLFPDLWFLEIPGRVAMPLFCWSLVRAWRITRDRLRFQRSILIAAFVAEMPYQYFIGGHLNVLFPLFGSLLILDRKPLGILCGLLLALCSSSYGLSAVACVLIMSHAPLNPGAMFVAGWVLSPGLPGVVSGLASAWLPRIENFRWPSLRPVSVLWFYPAHLALLSLIKILL